MAQMKESNDQMPTTDNRRLTIFHRKIAVIYLTAEICLYEIH